MRKVRVAPEEFNTAIESYMNAGYEEILRYKRDGEECVIMQKKVDVWDPMLEEAITVIEDEVEVCKERSALRDAALLADLTDNPLLAAILRASKEKEEEG